MEQRAVLFDLDGTLLNSLEDLADAMNAVLGRRQIPPHPLDAYRYFVGEGMEMLVRRALPETLRDEATVRAVLEEMGAEYASRSTRKTRPYPGVPQLLDGLAQRGMTTAILTNKPQLSAQDIVSRLLGSWRFAAVVGARSDLPRKPAPAGALQIARELEIAPRQWLYLGDTATDMKTANAAGMWAVGALWGFRDREELLGAGARTLLERPEDLLEHLG